MKICTSINQEPSVRAKADELFCPSNRLSEAISWCGRHPDKRMIVYFENLKETNITIPKMFELQFEIDNLYFCFKTLQDMIQYARYESFNDIDPRHYMCAIAADTWALVRIYKYYKVSDIKIAGSLCFDMEHVKQEIHDAGINVRLDPTGAMPKEMIIQPGIQYFWILPQHTKYYESYVDIFDVMDPEPVREKTLVDYYSTQRDFDLPMRFFFTHLSDIKVLGTFVDERWVNKRLNCKQKCFGNSKGCIHCLMRQETYGAVMQHYGKSAQ